MNNTTDLDTNSSSSQLPPLEWNYIKTIQSTIYGSIVIATIVGNLLTLYLFARYKRYLRSPTHYFLANLALADLLVGLLALPYLAVFNITFRWYFGVVWCYSWTILHFWFCSCSILSTLAICVERFIGVKYPLKHLKIMNRRTILYTIAGVWGIALILSALPLVIWPDNPAKFPYRCSVSLKLGRILVASIGIFHIPAAVIGILYYMIYKAAVSPTKELMKSLDSSTNRDNDLKEKYKKQVRLARKLAFLVGFLILSYFPFFTFLLILGFNPTFVSKEVFFLIAWLRYFNSCVNPMIYAFSVPGYKAALAVMFKKSEDSKSGRNGNSITLKTLSTGET